MRTLLVNGHIYSPSEVFATAVMVEDGIIAWIGSEGGASVHTAEADEIVDLADELLAPAFLDLSGRRPGPGFLPGPAAGVQIADDWTDAQWAEAADRPLAVVPRGNLRLRSRIGAGAPTALVPAPGQDGWECLRAAVYEVTEAERLTARAAFSALTRGAWRLVGRPDLGVLAVGAPADFVQWRIDELAVESPDVRISNWSTDPRSATPGLPVIAPGADLPALSRMWVGGIPQ